MTDTPVLVMGYLAWVVITLFAAGAILGTASVMTMDTQSLRTWVIAGVLAILVVGASSWGLVAVS